MPKTRLVKETFRLSKLVDFAKKLEVLVDQLGRARDEILELSPPGDTYNAEEKIGRAQGNLNDAISWVQNGIGQMFVDGGGEDAVVYEVEPVE